VAALSTVSAWIVDAAVRRTGVSITLVLVWTCIALGIVVVAVFAWYAARRRRATMEERARSLGFTRVPNDPTLVARFAAYGDPFDLGHHRRVTNVLVGTRHGRPAIAADYSYKTRGGRKGSTTHHLGVVGIRTGLWLPSLSVLPEAVISQPTDTLLDNDVIVENREFNRTFTVTSAEPETAGDVLDPAMTEFLLFHPHEGLKVNGAELVRVVPGHLRPEHLQPALDYLDAVLERIPERARRNLRASDQG